MAAQAVHADAVDGDAADGGGVDTEPVIQLAIIEIDFFQLAEAVETTQLLAISADETCDATSYARNLF